MDYLNASTLITATVASFGSSAVVVLASVIGVSVGLLVFRFGWLSLMNLPGGIGYDSSKGSGLSRWKKPVRTRNAHGGANLLE